jgi:hypothetical protein
LVVRRDRETAGKRVFAHRQIEELRELIERHHFLSVDRSCDEGPPPFARQNGVGRRRGGRLRAERSKHQQERAGSEKEHVAQ